MFAIDRIYTKSPFYGTRRITAELNRRPQWKEVDRKRVRRLMRLMGIEAIYPKPRLSKANELHFKYPYLLKEVIVNRPNQVWSTDITYIPTLKGFVYLVVIMDWYSRYVLSWDVSNSLESSFCIKVLERSIARHGKPDIFNSDQGSQFTDGKFTGILNQAGVKVSMDGRGRCWDNIFIERLWRSVKYEEVYLKEYPTLPDARSSIERYFQFYNESRPHQSLGYRTPKEVHFSTGNR
jgi:putative transposase